MTKPFTSKADLIKSVAASASLTRGQAEKAINAVFDNIALDLKNGTDVRIAGFGAFKTKFRPSRTVNLHGGDSVTRAVHTVGFTPYDALKTYED